MDDNLQALLDLADVNAAMVFDDSGRLVAQRGRAIYDRPLCEQVCAVLSKAVDSIALGHPDWDSATARYADGVVLLRNVGPVAGASYVLAVVANATLNPAFATVALRVVSSKAKRAIEVSQGLAPTGAGSSILGASAAAAPKAISSQVLGPTPHPASGSRPVLATSGLSWSQVGGSGVSSRIMTADAASSAYLTRCTKALAQAVGPMAKVFVEEAVRRLGQDAPFSLAQARPLAEALAGQVDDDADRATFLKALEAKDTTPAEASKTLTTFADRSAVLFRPDLYREEILPAYQAFSSGRERVQLMELLARARPSAAKARGEPGPSLLIQSELDAAMKKLKSEATPFGDLDLLVKRTLVPGLVDLLCVPWELGTIPVQKTWGCPLSEYLEPRSAWIAEHLLRGVPPGTELKLPSGAHIRLCAPAAVERLGEELALVPRPPGPEPLQRDYDTLHAMVDALADHPDLALALWSR